MCLCKAEGYKTVQDDGSGGVKKLDFRRSYTFYSGIYKENDNRRWEEIE